MITRLPSFKQTPAAKKLRVGIVVARYHESLTKTLLEHTLKTLTAYGVRQIQAIHVPGSYETVPVVMQLARSKKFDAVIALGIVLQGKTSHANHIALACAINLQRIGMETAVPIIHQILTPRTLQDARKRVRLRAVEAAQTAIEMGVLIRKLKSHHG